MTTETLTHTGSGSVSKLTGTVNVNVQLIRDNLVVQLKSYWSIHYSGGALYTLPDPELLICKRRRHAKPRTFPFQACVD